MSDLELPPPLMTCEPGSFARRTIVERKPQILREVAQAHPYPSDILDALEDFAREIAAEPVRPLREDAPDVKEWNDEWAAHRGRKWLELPWYFAESFFYRRLMEIVRFYRPGPWRDVDPFGPPKIAVLERALPSFLTLLEQAPVAPEDEFASALYAALWGNRADLSNRTISATAADHFGELLIDDTQLVWRFLNETTPARVDIVTDNSGLELLSDLRLADLLLRRGLAGEVRFHLKRMPFFVSDAMLRDLWHSLDRLSTTPPPGASLALRLRAAIATGRITLRDDPFWSSPFSYWRMPKRITAEMAASGLVIFKGDVNYRRLLDDRHWPPTAHMAEIASYFPAPFVVLRTLKGEIIVDLKPGQAEALSSGDPTWMINGRRGLVQLVKPGGER